MDPSESQTVVLDSRSNPGITKECLGDIVIISTADWDHPLWTNNQHTAVRLADRGFRVLYVESLGLRRPTREPRDLKRIVQRCMKSMRGLRRVSPRLFVYSPLVLPFYGSRTARALNNFLLTSCLSLLLKILRFRKVIIWSYNPFVFRLRDAVHASLLIYHCVDDLSSVPGIPSRQVRQAEGSMLERGDVVFATSRPLFERLGALQPGKTYYLPNVADFDHFSAARSIGAIPPEIARIPRPRLGFVGAISSHKLDLDLISGVAEQRPHWHWVLVGPPGIAESRHGRAALQRPNVHLLGHRPYQALPNYLRGIDVAVLPCKINPYTRSMFPLKFFEYLAAGKPVVATSLPALQGYSESYVKADSVEEFCQAVEMILSGRRPDEQLCLELAKRHTWDSRLDQMLEIIDHVLQSDYPEH
ncbi:MAG: glycosyltransferase [Desulfomonilaceae bacterium]